MAQPLTPMTLSRENREQWGNGFNNATPNFQHTMTQIVQGIQEIASEPESDDAKAAGIFGIGKALEDAAASIGYKLVLFSDAESVDFIDDSGMDPQTERHAQVLLQSSLRPGSPTTEGARAGLRALAGSVDTGAGAWEKALAQESLTQGSGESRESPLYVGASNITAGPTIIPIHMDIIQSARVSLTSDEVRNVQSKLLASLRGLCWRGRKDHGFVWMKLHPWSVIFWINTFTGSILGANGLSHINSIFAAFTKQHLDELSHKDASRASMLSQQSNITKEERGLYHSMSIAIMLSIPANNAYTTFRAAYEGSAFVVKYAALYELITRVPHYHPDGHVARSINKQAGALNLRGQGRDLKFQLSSIIAHNMGWPQTYFTSFYQKYQTLAQITSEFGGAFLLLSDKSLLPSIRRNALGALGEIIQIVHRDFPALGAIVGVVDELVMKDFMSDDFGKIDKVTTNKINTSAGEDDMVTRIRDALGED